MHFWDVTVLNKMKNPLLLQCTEMFQKEGSERNDIIQFQKEGSERNDIIQAGEKAVAIICGGVERVFGFPSLQEIPS